MRKYILLTLLLSAVSAHAKQPNVILIMTDDQGYGDIAVHGNEFIDTPNLDKLHNDSLRMTNFHVDPTCAPTRGALMSGKYSHRARVWHTILGGNSMRAGQITMAEVFKNSGYNTALFGKWHLGANYPYRPMDRGFDEWLGCGNGGPGTTDDYFTNDRVNDHYWHNGEYEYREGFAPEVFFRETCDFIKKKGKDKPFFIYLPTYVPHGPYTLPDSKMADKYLKRFSEKFKKQAKKLAYYYAGIEVIDNNIGHLRKTLKAEGLDQNTIIIFMTDNGGTAGRSVFNAGMQGGKGSAYEGGHRVPFFIHWPKGGIKHGNDVSELNAHIDVLPTLVDLLDLTPPRGLDVDGRSFKKQLYNPQLELPERTVFVENQRTLLAQKWHKTAAMTSRWRLVDNKALFDIKDDPSQKMNVIEQYPEVVAQLRSDFDVYWEKVSPNDREMPITILGHPSDRETFLSSEDWYVNKAPWNHDTVGKGVKNYGSWHVQVHEEGTYQIELRRWPKEVNAPIAGIPELSKKVDAWSPQGPRFGLLYGGSKPSFKALPVKYMKLTMGEFSELLEVDSPATHKIFELQLKKEKYEIKAELLDSQKKVIAGAYYVYCRKL